MMEEIGTKDDLQVKTVMRNAESDKFKLIGQKDCKLPYPSYARRHVRPRHEALPNIKDFDRLQSYN